jgi:2'-5' RNA ligase
MKVIRTFVAVLIDEDLKRGISEVQEFVKKLAPDVKWVAPESLHVTLKFLGGVPEDVIPEVNKAVDDAVRSHPCFDLSISGMGAFPNPARAKVVWVGIKDGGDDLKALASAVDESLSRLGFEREDRPFKAHITIGRVKMSKHLDDLAAGIRELDASDLGTQRVCGVAVMKSELLREGAVYTPLSVSKLS